MQGCAFAGRFQAPPQPLLFGERGRMDERMDLVRSATDGRYVYLRNFFPHVSQAQHVAYQFETPTTRLWYDWFTTGKTNEAQSIFWRVPKPVEELYDLQVDPDEVVNLANSAEHQAVLQQFRDAMREHVLNVRDVCFLPEREMVVRSKNSSPYEIARDESQYPLARILNTAQLSSNRLEPADKELVDRLLDPESAVRYWAALGFLVRGASSVSRHEQLLLSTLEDPSPDVRIVAAQTLVSHGSPDTHPQALRILGDLADATSQGVLTSMAALSAIESLGNQAAALKPLVAQLATDGPSPDERYDSYVPRLIENIAQAEKKADGPRP